MLSPIIKQFVVEGTAPFPFAMLNVDQCWPARAADAAAIADSCADDHRPAGRKIIMATAAKYAPNRQRWTALGWRVLD